MPGETSPVNAPLSSKWTSCAPSPYGRRSLSMSVSIERRAVNGGQITTSTPSASSLSSRYESFWTAWMASRWVLCIFQFAATIGRRAISAPPGRRSRAARAPRALGGRDRVTRCLGRHRGRGDDVRRELEEDPALGRAGPRGLHVLEAV